MTHHQDCSYSSSLLAQLLSSDDNAQDCFGQQENVHVNSIISRPPRAPTPGRQIESPEMRQKKIAEKLQDGGEARLVYENLSTPHARTVVPIYHRLEKVEPTVHNTILPSLASFNYSAWSTDQILEFLKKSMANGRVLDAVMKYRVNGPNLLYCFLDKETSEVWRREAGLTPHDILRVRMVLGKIHNIYYNL